MARPNILYIHSHDTGRYIQPYGHRMSTPNMQALAEEGVLFRQCFCGGPTCSPSRAALLTGQAPHSSGMTGLAHRGFSLNDYSRHIVHTLKGAGYRTVLCGHQHVAHEPERIGYDEVLPVDDVLREPAGKAAELLRSHPAEPFFLSVGFFETHRPYHKAGTDEDPRYCIPPAPLPDTPRTRCDMACFNATARSLDEKMGAVFDALKEGGLEDSTLVVCTTDHGIAFPAMKCNLTDHGIGVMLIMRGPGGFGGGKVVDGMVSQIDIFPTLCEMLEIERPAWLQGTSMMPLVRGEAEEMNEEIFSEVTYHAAYEPMRCVRTKEWKYIRRFDERTRAVLPNIDDSPSKDVWVEHGWAERPPGREQLYDLILDPNEACNRAAEPSLAGVLEEMRGRLDRWMRATDDPLLKGPVPAPSGAEVNDPDGSSPSGPCRIVP